MVLCTVLISVVLLNIFTPVRSEFYIEIATPTVDRTKLIENISRRGTTAHESDSEGKETKFKVTLQVCSSAFLNGRSFQVVCSPIPKQEMEEVIYANVNFFGVSEFALPGGHVWRIDASWFQDYLPQALAIGDGLQRDVYFTTLIDKSSDTNIVKNKVYSFLSPLIDSEEEFKAMLQFLSINHIGFFYNVNMLNRQLFARYVAILQKLVNAAGYKKESGSLVIPASVQDLLKPPNKNMTPPPSPPKPQPKPKIKAQPQPQPQPQPKLKPQSPTRSKSNARSLCLSLFRSKARSRSQSKRWSPLRSFSKSLSWSSRSKSSSKSQTKVYPTLSTRSLSPSRPPPKTPSAPLNDSEILAAAGVLAFKMIDPCVLAGGEYMDVKTVDYFCTTYCRFLGATLQVYGESFSPECEDLASGSCNGKFCECAKIPLRKYVRMLKCNNALRLHMYQQAQHIASPQS